MNSIIIRDHMDFNPDRLPPGLVNQSKLSGPHPARNVILQSQLNHSQGLEEKEITGLYSKKLLTLVQECLLREPEHRPNVTQLRTDTDLALQRAMSDFPVNKSTSWSVEPIMKGPFKDFPVNGKIEAQNPPTSWDVHHIYDIDTNMFYDEATGPPVHPTILSTVISRLSPVVAASVKTAASSTTSLFSMMARSSTPATTPESQGSTASSTATTRSPPTSSPPAPGIAMAKSLANGLTVLGLKGAKIGGKGLLSGAKFAFNKAVGGSGEPLPPTSVPYTGPWLPDDEWLRVDSADSPMPPLPPGI